MIKGVASDSDATPLFCRALVQQSARLRGPRQDRGDSLDLVRRQLSTPLEICQPLI